MISDNVKNIFSFLEFLNSNVEFLNTCIPLWEEVESLRRDYASLNPKENYQHKFEREKIEKKGTDVFQNFRIKCKNVVNNKINELDIADLSNPVNNHFKYLGDFSIFINSQNYDKKDVELIKKAKDDYISFFRNLKLDIDAILPFDLLRDLRDDVLMNFKPFLTEEDKLKISKFKSFDEFLEFCKPQLTGFKLNSEIQKSIDNLNNTLYTTNEENAIDLLISNVEKFKSDNENSIKKYFKDNNIQMFLNNTEKITDNKLLEELSLYFQFSDLLLNAKNKLETIPLLKEIENRSNLKSQLIKNPKVKNNEVLSEMITHSKKAEISTAIRKKYSSYKGKDFKILYEALVKLDLFPPKGKRSLFFRCLKNENYDINNVQMLEDQYFKKGGVSGKGNYIKSKDEIQCDAIIQYLETIIETK